jgi:hypothetical protein
LSELRLEGKHPDGFGRQFQTMKTVLAAAALGLADAGPIGRPINRALETVPLNETFQQGEIVLVFLLPVRAQTPLHLTQ